MLVFKIVKSLQCILKLGNLVMQQFIGIPMGIDPAPFRANLILYSREVECISPLLSLDKVKARHLYSTKHFIDDPYSINDGAEFGKCFAEKYPTLLEFKVEHQVSRASFINLGLTIKQGTFVDKLFDKRDAFPFSIVRMPHRDSTIPKNTFYSAMKKEFIQNSLKTLHK